MYILSGSQSPRHSLLTHGPMPERHVRTRVNETTNLSPKERKDFIVEQLGLKENSYRYNQNY